MSDATEQAIVPTEAATPGVPDVPAGGVAVSKEALLAPPAAKEPDIEDVLGKMYDDAEREASPVKRHDVRDEPSGKFTKKGEFDPAASDKSYELSTVKPAANADPFEIWPAEWKSKLSALPPETHQIVAESHAALRDAVVPVLQEAEAFKADAQSYFEQINPFVEQLKANSQYLDRRASDLKQHPAEIVRGAMRQEETLAYGQMAQKEELFAQMAEVYGLSHMLAGSQPQPTNDPFADLMPQQQQRDPRLLREIHDLHQEKLRIEHEKNRYERQLNQHSSQQGERQFQSAWSQFASAKGQDGQPLRPFANEVQPIMQRLLQSGRARTSDEAYAMAAKPMQDRLNTEIQARDAHAKRTEQARQAAVEKAKRAAPVKVSGMSRNGGASFTNWNDAINAAMNG